MTVKASSSLPSAKRRKIKRTDASDELESVIILEKQIQQALVDNASLNALLDLLHIALSSKSSEIILKAVFALYRIFTQVIAKGLLQPDSDGDLDAASVRTWLLSRLDSFTTLLCGLLKDEEKTLRVCTYSYFISLVYSSLTGFFAQNIVFATSSTIKRSRGEQTICIYPTIR